MMSLTDTPGRSRWARLALGTAASLALAGCVSLGSKPPDQLFRLTPDETAPTGAEASAKLGDAIVVFDPDTERSLDAVRVPVRVDASSVAYLKDAAWIEKPARQFRSLLAETLRARTGGLVIESSDFEAIGKTRVGGRLLQMGYDAQQQAVVVRFDAMLSQNSGSQIRTRRFEAVVNGIEPKAKDVGPALNRAANDVARQVAQWVIAGG